MREKKVFVQVFRTERSFPTRFTCLREYDAGHVPPSVITAAADSSEGVLVAITWLRSHAVSS